MMHACDLSSSHFQSVLLGFKRKCDVTSGRFRQLCKSVYSRYEEIMSVRLKKLIGSIVIVVLAFLYALVATTIAASKLADSSGWIHLVYFFVTGLMWVVPAIFIISWMTKPGKAEKQ